MNAVSNAVKINSLKAIIDSEPSKADKMTDKIDLSGVSQSQLIKLLPTVVKNKVVSQMPYIAPVAAFYPLVKLRNPELGKPAEDGFNWIMSSDNLIATENVARVLTQSKDGLLKDPETRMMFSQMLKEGLAKKTELLKQNPQKAERINKQIAVLNKIAEIYK